MGQALLLKAFLLGSGHALCIRFLLLSPKEPIQANAGGFKPMSASTLVNLADLNFLILVGLDNWKWESMVSTHGRKWGYSYLTQGSSLYSLNTFSNLRVNCNQFIFSRPSMGESCEGMRSIASSLLYKFKSSIKDSHRSFSLRAHPLVRRVKLTIKFSGRLRTL